MTTLQEQDQRLADKVVRTHYNLSADDYINENWADEIDLVKLAIMFERKRQSEFVERMRELGQAMPPNAISMNIQKALKKFEGE
jgi:hypothetical protein